MQRSNDLGVPACLWGVSISTGVPCCRQSRCRRQRRLHRHMDYQPTARYWGSLNPTTFFATFSSCGLSKSFSLRFCLGSQRDAHALAARYCDTILQELSVFRLRIKLQVTSNLTSRATHLISGHHVHVHTSTPRILSHGLTLLSSLCWVKKTCRASYKASEQHIPST